MPWTATALVIAAIVLVSLQGYSLFVRRDCKTPTRFAGTLNLFVAVSGLIAFFLFSAGSLILSPEYSVLLVQGTAAWIWAIASIVGVSVGSGLALHSARCGRELPNRLKWILVVSTVTGITAALRFGKMNPTDSSPFLIRGYDLWWPLFLMWILLCLSEWITTTLNIRGRSFRICAATFLITAVALRAVSRSYSHFVYADSYTVGGWKLVVGLGVPGLMLLGTWSALASFGILQGKKRRAALAVIVGLIGLLSALSWMEMIPLSWFPSPWTVLIVWLLGTALSAAPRLYRAARAGTLEMPDIGQPGHADDCVALVAVVLMVASIADMSHYATIDPVWDLGILILAWIVLLEIIGGTPLWALHSETIKRMIRVEAPLRTLWTAAKTRLGKLFSKDSKPDDAQPAKAPFSLLLKFIVGLVLLVIIGEIPNIGRTIVQPFNSAGLTDKEVGRAVSDRIVNTLGLAGQDLQPDLLVLSKDRKTDWIAPTGEDAGGLQASVKSSDIQIPGTNYTVPIGFFIAPIQAPLRQLLGVRVIGGSVQMEGDQYVLLANSSRGQTWRVPAPQGAAPPVIPAVPAPATPAPGAQPKAGENPSATPPPENSTSKTPAGPNVQDLADRLAYNIISSDPAFVGVGMASSSSALPSFREGLAAWKEFERTGDDYDALSKSIESFHEATRADPNFALAHYRLGRALTADYQPGAAVAAFRASLAANPKFVAGHIALADTLYSFDDYYYTLPAILSQAKQSTPEQRTRNRNEAKQLLQRIIRDLKAEATLADRAGAYAGLCRQSFDSIFDTSPDLASHYVAFFYCKRAEYLYSQLSSTLRSNSQVRDSEVWVLTAIAEILEYTDPPSAAPTESLPPEADVPWRCTATPDDITPDGQIKPLDPEPAVFVEPALRYYGRAQAMAPDDVTIRCMAASANLRLHPDATYAMDELEKDDRAHVYLGSTLAAIAKDVNPAAEDEEEVEKAIEQAAPLYQLSLSEYERAIELAPADIDALNGYAYTLWCWRLNWPREKPPRGADAAMAHKAEDFARRAIRLALDSGSKALHAQVQSTLGELLLAQARPHEAVTTLEEVALSENQPHHSTKALKAEIGTHWIFNEVRWDLAQAYLCENANDLHSQLPEKDRHDFRKNAADLLQEIRENEIGREDQPFTRDPRALDPANPQTVCLWSAETTVEQMPDPKEAHYKLAKNSPSYASRVPCNWLGIVADAKDQKGGPVEGMALHVWGGGVDTTVLAGNLRQDLGKKPDPLETHADVLLSYTPMDTHDFYFAQLEDSDHKAVSPAYSVRTYANVGTQCGRNLISLTFVPTQ